MKRAVNVSAEVKRKAVARLAAGEAALDVAADLKVDRRRLLALPAAQGISAIPAISATGVALRPCVVNPSTRTTGWTSDSYASFATGIATSKTRRPARPIAGNRTGGTRCLPRPLVSDQTMHRATTRRSNATGVLYNYSS